MLLIKILFMHTKDIQDNFNLKIGLHEWENRATGKKISPFRPIRNDKNVNKQNYFFPLNFLAAFDPKGQTMTLNWQIGMFWSRCCTMLCAMNCNFFLKKKKIKYNTHMKYVLIEYSYKNRLVVFNLLKKII